MSLHFIKGAEICLQIPRVFSRQGEFSNIPESYRTFDFSVMLLPPTNTVLDFFYNEVSEQQGIIFSEFCQSVEGFLRIFEIECGVRLLGVIKNVKVSKSFLFFCCPWNSWKRMINVNNPNTWYAWPLKAYNNSLNHFFSGMFVFH